MMMSADDPRDLRMASNNGTKRVSVAQGDLVHLHEAGHERRVVHSHQGWPRRLRRQGPVQPFQLGRGLLTVRSAGYQGVQHDQTNRVILDGILNKVRVGCNAWQMSK